VLLTHIFQYIDNGYYYYPECGVISSSEDFVPILRLNRLMRRIAFNGYVMQVCHRQSTITIMSEQLISSRHVIIIEPSMFYRNISNATANEATSHIINLKLGRLVTWEMIKKFMLSISNYHFIYLTTSNINIYRSRGEDVGGRYYELSREYHDSGGSLYIRLPELLCIFEGMVSLVRISMFHNKLNSFNKVESLLDVAILRYKGFWSYMKLSDARDSVSHHPASVTHSSTVDEDGEDDYETPQQQYTYRNRVFDDHVFKL
jgi:hypothetical protein